VAREALESAGTPVMLLKTLPRGQSIVYKGRLPVERNILSFVGKEEEEEDLKSEKHGGRVEGSRVEKH